jgi:hypothetical protein
MSVPIDVIITSYNRLDLLERTLHSFYENVSFDFNMHIYDDFGHYALPKESLERFELLKIKYPKANFIFGDRRVGQVLAIDILMTHVKSKYYIKLEDDWECVSGGFLHEATRILDRNLNCICVWLRGIDSKAINYHPIKLQDNIWRFETEYNWRGFSWGASLHRLDDYKKIAPYSRYTYFNPRRAWESEKKIGEMYYKMEFYAATLYKKYFVHIGDEQGIRS